MKKGFKVFLLLTLVFTFMISTSSAYANALIAYKKGSTQSTGNYTNCNFKIYTAMTGGSAIWSESSSNNVSCSVVSESIGSSSTARFTKHFLGSVTPFPDNFDFQRPLYVEAVINSQTMPQRDLLATSAYAVDNLVWLGAWSSSATYRVNDVVTDGGSSYVAITSSTNLQPSTNPTNWDLLAEQGPQGIQGIQGPEGPAGTDGAVGPAGPQGDPGPTGPTGATGATGPAGTDGAVGPAGPQGLQGVSGPAGADGAVGPAGPQGDPGIAGTNGLACWDLNGNDACDPNEDINGDTFCTVLDCVGPAGPQGSQGVAGPEGPQGPAGTDGATGPAGPQGLQGVAGPEGPQGLTGADGAMGPAGPQGIQGVAGPEGPQGPAGTQGDPGIAGTNGLACWDLNGNDACDPNEDINADTFCTVLDCAGPAGPQGTQGLTGSQGPAGTDGAMGPAGPKGDKGDTGDVGPQGPQGIQGLTGSQGPAGTDGAVGPAGPQGIQGVAGSEGPQGPAGTQGDPGIAGTNGLACWDLNGNDACDPNEDINADTFCTVLDCAGPAGPQGSQGVAGPAGTDGAVGPAGSDGAMGPAGPQGLQGVAGPAGTDGAAGPQGPQGIQGVAGPAGTDGAVGPQGPQGIQGPAGTSSWADGTGVVTTNVKVGIGTSNPQTTIHNAETSISPSRGIMAAQHNDGAQAGSIVFRKSRGTEANPAQLVENDYIGIFAAQYWNNTAYDRSAQFGFRTDGPVTAGSAPTAIMFYTGASTNAGDPLILAERLRISSNGNVGIGTSTPSQKLEVAGNASFAGGSANHAICWKTDGKTLGYCSDAIASDGSCTCN